MLTGPSQHVGKAIAHVGERGKWAVGTRTEDPELLAALGTTGGGVASEEMQMTIVKGWKPGLGQ